MTDGFRLREAASVPELLERDRLVQRMREIRASAVEQRAVVERWNRLHPEEEPIDTSFEDAVIAWCDGEGPMPGAAA